MFSEEEKPQDIERTRTLETLSEKLGFIQTRFIDGTLPIKPTKEVASEGEDFAKVEFHGDLFKGETTGDMLMKIKEALGVDLSKNGDFKLTGDFEYTVYEILKTQTPTYLLVRIIVGETEIMFFEGALLEMFEEAEGLQRVSISESQT